MTGRDWDRPGGPSWGWCPLSSSATALSWTTGGQAAGGGSSRLGCVGAWACWRQQARPAMHCCISLPPTDRAPPCPVCRPILQHPAPRLPHARGPLQDRAGPGGARAVQAEVCGHTGAGLHPPVVSWPPFWSALATRGVCEVAAVRTRGHPSCRAVDPPSSTPADKAHA